MEHRDEIEDMTEVEREEIKKEAAEYGVTFTQIINMTQEEKDNAGVSACNRTLYTAHHGDTIGILAVISCRRHPYLPTPRRA